MAMNKQWILKKRPEGEIKAGDLVIEETAIPICGEGQVHSFTLRRGRRKNVAWKKLLVDSVRRGGCTVWQRKD